MRKRKIVVEDSDDDLPASDPIPYKMAAGRSKKPRMSAVFSDVEDEEEGENAPELNAFAKRLTKYQKSPKKAKSRGMLVMLLVHTSLDRCCRSEEDRRR